jgi:diacylglycerol O-acyltransferase/trehalose O-mycolyltransferase
MAIRWSRRVRRRVLVSSVAACTAAAMTVGVTSHAWAVDPDRLRDGCVWRTAEEQAQHVQTCTFYSESLGRNVVVQVRASDNEADETEQAVYFLDGLGANPEYSTWSTADAGAVSSYSTGTNLVMPAGGAGEWMTDWQQAPTGGDTALQWDGFVGTELPAYLATNFDVSTSNNAIVGVSMSGAPAVILGLNHPEVFTVIRSYSGYYETDNPVGWIAIPLIQIARADITNGLWAMWGLPLAPGNTWGVNDVSQRIAEAKANGQTVIISTGTGIPTERELSTAWTLIQQVAQETPELLPVLLPAAVQGLALGIVLEVGALVSTAILQGVATVQGLPIEFKYANGGHNWIAWAADEDNDAQEIEEAMAAASAASTTASAARSASASVSVPASMTARSVVAGGDGVVGDGVVGDEVAGNEAAGDVSGVEPATSVASSATAVPAVSTSEAATTTSAASTTSEEAVESSAEASEPATVTESAGAGASTSEKEAATTAESGVPTVEASK